MLHDIIRYVSLSDSLATAGQPTEAQLVAVAQAGFEVVVNLGMHADPRYVLADEAEIVGRLGMKYVHIPVSFSMPTQQNLDAFFSAMDQAGSSKVFVHCIHNKRVPVFVALYQIIKQGCSKSEALAQMREVWQPDATWEAFIEQSLQAAGEQLFSPP